MPSVHTVNQITAFVRQLNDSLPVPLAGETEATVRTRCRYKLRTLAKHLGRKTLPRAVLVALAQAAAEQGLHVNPPLATGYLALDTSVYFSRLPFDPAAAAFAREKALREFLLGAWDMLEPLQGLRPIRKEHVLPNGRRLDILCRDKSDRALVVVELKGNKSGDGIAGQMRDYLKQLSLQYPEKTIRGVVICGPNDRLGGRALTAKFPWPVQWYRYRVELSPAD